MNRYPDFIIGACISLTIVLFYVSTFCLGSTLCKYTLDDMSSYSHRDSDWYEAQSKIYKIK